jgi:addiction module HigA family antidote
MTRPFANGMPPVHPGEILREEFLTPLSMSASRLAAALHIPTNRITEILAERRALTADTALRLARALGTSPEFWLGLQKTYELRTAEQRLGGKLKSIKPIKTAAAV